MKTCWLIGGTSDSAEIARRLSARSIPYVVTVTTPAARNLYPTEAQVEVGKLSPQTALAFVRQHQVGYIADASHPFASEISNCAIALAQNHHIPYLRYERPAIAPSPTSDATVIDVDSIEQLANSSLLKHQRVLFTIGYRHLSKFAHLRQTSKLYARVLPSQRAIVGSLAAGFSPEEIIALRPPVSLALEIALWQQWNISCVVSKASGQLVSSLLSPVDKTDKKVNKKTNYQANASGEQVKRQAADRLGIQLVLIHRPAITYPQKTEHIEDVLLFCAEMLSQFS